MPILNTLSISAQTIGFYSLQLPTQALNHLAQYCLHKLTGGSTTPSQTTLSDQTAKKTNQEEKTPYEDFVEECLLGMRHLAEEKNTCTQNIDWRITQIQTLINASDIDNLTHM